EGRAQPLHNVLRHRGIRAGAIRYARGPWPGVSLSSSSLLFFDQVSETFFDQVDVWLRCRDALLRFLLERVEYINRVSIADRIDGPVGVTVRTLPYLDDRCSAEAGKSLGHGWMTFAHLRQE